MKVRDLIEILHDYDGEQDVLIWDSSTGETLELKKQLIPEDGDDTLAFEIDCKRNPLLEDKFEPTIEKWKQEAGIMVQKENFMVEHNFTFELEAQRKVTNLLYQKITEMENLKL